MTDFMTTHKKEYAEAVDINEDGFITSPGMFEGEPITIMHFYDLYLQGDGEHNYELNETYIEITQEDRDKFEGLLTKDDNWAILEFEENGFVSIETMIDDPMKEQEDLEDVALEMIGLLEENGRLLDEDTGEVVGTCKNHASLLTEYN